jgi:hypothetical protein
VLQSIDQQQRLGSCAHVARAWQAAATAATTELTLKLKEQPDPAAPLRDWLFKHGKHVQSIDLSFSSRFPKDYSGGILVVLPFQQLQQLRSLSIHGSLDSLVWLQSWIDQQPNSGA